MLSESDIQAAKSRDLVQVVESYGVKLQKAGTKEYKGLCPFHSEDTASFTVTPEKNLYRCMGCGAGGDPITFVRELEGLSFRQAVMTLNGQTESDHHATPQKQYKSVKIQKATEEEWEHVFPVPDSVPSPRSSIKRLVTNKSSGEKEWVSLPVAKRWTYRDANGGIIGYTVRVNLPPDEKGERKKEVLPQIWAVNKATGEASWRWLSFAEPRPVYGLDLLAQNPSAKVLVVEGEKACEAARELLAALGVKPSAVVVVAWPGGGKAIAKVDWSPLAGREVFLWPDADQKPYPDNHPKAGELMPEHEQPGHQAMIAVAKAVRETATAIKMIKPPVGVPDGWDLADEMPVGFDFTTHIRSHCHVVEFPAEVVEPPKPDGAAGQGATEPQPPAPAGDTVPSAQPIPEPTPVPAPAPKPVSAPVQETKGKKETRHLVDEMTVNEHFQALGFDRETYYFFSYDKQQMVTFTRGEFTETGLMSLAPLSYWEDWKHPVNTFCTPENPPSIAKSRKRLIDAILQASHRKGVFDPSNQRGRGAWRDDGRMVLHTGYQLVIDGKASSIPEFNKVSRYVYELDRALPSVADDALSDEEGQGIVDLALSFRWTRKASGLLLAGWAALAPFSGALQWRPHVWVTGGPGTGKALCHNSKILTPSGWTTMGEIKVGDLVTTPDNGFGRVMGKYPQGVIPVYKLTFADGRTVRASGDHLWKVRVRKEWRLRTTEQMIEILSRGTRSSASLAIPLAEPLDIDPNKYVNLPLHPYVLGALLGNGNLGSSTSSAGVRFTSASEEVTNRVSLLAPINSALVDVVKGKEGIDFRFVGLDKAGKSMRELLKDLRLLGTRSHNKFIPRAYLEASISDRVELLKGLMDTDGYVDEGGSMSYCTVSPQLAQDVAELVRSLGGIASIREKHPTYTYKGEKKQGQLAYNIHIRLKDRSMAFHLQRKVDRAKVDYQYADCLYLNVTSIERDGEDECSCIAIDHPDRLFVTDNFVVTHNTTLINEFVFPLLNGYDLFAQGNSSEAGIRQKLRFDALPVIFDESEQNDQRESARMQAVLALMRQSSSESAARTYKGTTGGNSMDFLVRSMFCLSSIQVGIKHQADRERLAVLALRPKRESDDAAGEWKVLKEQLYMLKRDGTLPARLMRRSLDLLPITLKNIDTFATAGAKKFGSQRDGDQYGTLLAGAWSLMSGDLVTEDDAMALLDAYDWADHVEHTEMDDSTQALSAILESRVRANGGVELSVYEVVESAVVDSEQNTLTMREADALLQRHGMRVKDGLLLFSNKSEALPRLVANAKFESDLRGYLKRITGATNFGNKAIKIGPNLGKAVAIPLTVVLPCDNHGVVEPPL